MHRSGASLLQTVMVFSPGCGTVSTADRQFQAAQPSHSDDFRNAPGPIGLDTRSFSLTR
ncbi:hypothetical protein B6U01_000195 [Salmonella enterica subsp. enterica serovar Orion]|nr:hypothetical protein [Salmonella enterica subsp. enterica serovar Orion]EDQ9238583.1 hypothetical protein [Salmonella enterica subsp. enterica serovar Orion]EDR0537825.1 hypothetical protein [Salmonella enterica subsp. enterica serovar Orion]EDS6175143.1 hypothetical protein [Salmonella enterica subsp. enterica serovar Orion]EDT8576792.1 hypothetical protein [Salmonella enterica subsp. enterica serovar Orion]